MAVWSWPAGAGAEGDSFLNPKAAKQHMTWFYHFAMWLDFIHSANITKVPACWSLKVEVGKGCSGTGSLRKEGQQLRARLIGLVRNRQGPLTCPGDMAQASSALSGNAPLSVAWGRQLATCDIS